MINDINYIKKIINEEFQNAILEADKNEYKFSQVVAADFWNYKGFSNDYDISIDNAYITINWNINLVLDEQGVTKFNVNIEGVSGKFLVNYLDKQTNEITLQEMDESKDVSQYDWNYPLDGNLMMMVGNGFRVKELHFDFENNRCTVVF